MLKNVFFAAVAAALIAAVTLLVQITPVEAGTVTCNAGGEGEVSQWFEGASRLPEGVQGCLEGAAGLIWHQLND